MPGRRSIERRSETKRTSALVRKRYAAMAELGGDPVYLTPAGRRRLEEQVARYTAQVAGWRSDDTAETANEERGDAAERLIEADNLMPARDLLARTQAVLARA